MIGRSPNYLGKAVSPGDAGLVAGFILLTPMVVLSLTALAVVTEAGRAVSVTDNGPRDFTAILFAYASCMSNNGQRWLAWGPTTSSTTSRRCPPC